ncbi:MAG: oligoendopeptidase F, partial [Clostridia bacterium]|nr:oligoendopeptidase F [Clostridia bacterium]
MKRDKVPEERKWKIEDIYPTDEEWEKDFARLSGVLDFSAYKGHLGDRDTLLRFFIRNDAVSAVCERLAVYAQMRHDEDAGNSVYTAMYSRMNMLYSKYSVALAFFTPEMAKVDEDYLKGLIQDPDFADYDYELSRILAERAHAISEPEEKIVGLSGDVLGSFNEIFGMIDNVDLPLTNVTYEGTKTRLTHGLYGIMLRSEDRRARRTAYYKYYKAYESLINTLTSVYAGSVKSDVLLARVYKFDSCMEKALFYEDVDRKVYDNLLKAVDESLPVMHRYIRDRKKILGLNKQYFYDIYVPLTAGVDVKYSYDEAYERVIEGLAPLGKEYQDLLRRGHDERWLDVEETEGKRSGAYSIGCKGMHPYVLLNYQPTLNEVFTIAHEMGHSIHTYYSCEAQPYAKSDYKIFVAEVASTVNEVLLLKDMLSKADSDDLKKYLLNYYLDTIRTTLYRQTMFAEFEYEAHSLAEKDEPLTKEVLCQIYADLGRKYYGDGIVHDFHISCEWMRIPHFYRAFYVYKYATGITAAICIAN